MTFRTFDGSRLLRAATLLAAAAFIAVYIAVALARLSYPFELEWMEGGMVDHVQRVLDGQPLYVAPSLDFVPYGYTPLYYYLAAGMTRLLGTAGFLPLRLLSLLASLGCFALLYGMVTRETGSRAMGLVAAGLFAATYQEVAFWFDTARVNMLFLLFALGAMGLLRRWETRTAWAAAGVLLALALLTKQVGIVLALPLVVWAGFQRRDRVLWCAGAFVLVAGGALLLLARAHPYWFWYYTLIQPARHPLLPFQAVHFVLQDLPMKLAIACLMVVAWLLLVRGEGRRWGLLLFMAGLAGAAFLPRIKEGGGVNDLIPIYAVLAMLFAIALHKTLQALGSAAAPPISPFHGARLHSFVWLTCLVQFSALIYNPISPLPTAADRAAGERLIQTMAAIPGDVLLLCHGYLPRLAGKEPHAQSIAVTDVLAAGVPEARAPLVEDLRQAVREQRYRAIILDVLDPLVMCEIELDRYYEKQGDVFRDGEQGAFLPRCGWQTRPEWIFVPRADTTR